MIDELNLLYGSPLLISEKIFVRQVTLNQIREFGEKDYYNLIYTFISKPFDNKVMLDDAGIDYETIDEFTLFLYTYRSISEIQKTKDISFLISGLDFTKMEIFVNKENEETILYDKENNTTYDRLIHTQIVNFIHKSHYISTIPKYNPGNAKMKQMLINDERRRLKRKKKHEWKSILTPIVSSLVWHDGMNFNNVWELTHFQVYDGFMRKRKIKDYENLMLGIYTGNLDVKKQKINMEKIVWYSENSADVNEEIQEFNRDGNKI